MARRTAVLFAIVGLATGLPAAHAQNQSQGPDVGPQDQSPNERSPVQRGPRLANTEGTRGSTDGPTDTPAVFPFEFRTIDGTFNNLANPLQGAAGIEFLRLVPAAYGDGVGSPAGSGRPSARLISSVVAAQDSGSVPNAYRFSDFVWQWGQFLDHDIDETPVASPAEEFDIVVPAGDPWFDPRGTGEVTISLDRSAASGLGMVRQQINNITAYIDAANVYGSDEERARELRTLDGTGKLKTSDGDLLPFNVNGFENAPTAYDPSFFLAGDIRANEQVGLIAMHTLFVREHNRLATQIARDLPHLDGDSIYEHARAMVAAEMQAITYNEFLPKLLGPGAIPPYAGYRPEVDAGISNLFATAAYRVGHTMLSSELKRVDAQGREIPGGHLELADAFFVPGEIVEAGIEPVLRGLASQDAQDVDVRVIDNVRNFLFGPPGSGGFDLVSLNIQRGRDHGLPSYNELRVAFGRPPARTFRDVGADRETADRLADVYSHPDEIDAWVGLLAERHRPGAFVGETLSRILRDQFIRLRDGDRFWYESYLPPSMSNQIQSLTLSEIIRMNTSVRGELQPDVFVTETICVADLAPPFGMLDVFDFLAFQNEFMAGRLDRADLDGDGQLTLFDFLVFQDVFAGGCD
ncbi:MAG: peroxidase family protein [Phycisphaerales bacterium]